MHPAGGVALAVGLLVLGGVFLPMLSSSGETFGALIDSDWQAAGAITTGLLLILGGAVGFVSVLGRALAAGASLTFLGIWAVTLRPVADALSTSGDFGLDIGPGIGLFAWGLAAVGAVAVLVLGLTGLSGRPTNPWPFATSAAGLLLYWVGVVVPPEGLEFGDQLWFGDVWFDAAVALLLIGLPAAAVILVALRTPAAALFAVGVAGAWAVSWLVFAIDGSAGGLFVPYPDTPALAALSLVLISLCGVGALWWSTGSAAGAVGVTSTGSGLVAGQVLAIVICGATALTVAGGVAVADDQVSTFSSSVLGTGATEGPATEPFADDEAFVEDDFDESSGFDGDFSPDVDEPDAFDDPPDSSVSSCVEVICQPPAETWVVSLGSFFSEADAVAAEPNLPATGILVTNDYASLNPNIWMVYYDGGYTSGEQAVQYCYEVGRTTPNECYARRLSDDPSLDPNDPSLIVYP